MPKPRSLFAHIFLWAAFLLVLTNAAWLLIFRLAEVEPRARGVAQFSASVVNLVRVALLTATPDLRPVLLQELSDREGIRLFPRDSRDDIDPLPADSFIHIMAEETRTLLGRDTVISLRVNHEPGLWISFALAPGEPDEFWLILPSDRTHRRIPWLWMGWGSLAACITLGIAWLLASRIGRRLTRMADAARQVGQGRIPAQLPETGPEELQCLANAFNRMSHDLDLHEKERAEILAGISHDLRTPLSRIRLEAELSLPEGAAREGMAADIMQMDAIIGQFLDYARGEGEEPPEEILPLALLSEVAQRANSIGQPVELTLADIPPLRLKPRAITRALDNLISNAWKYGRPPVVLRGALADGWLELSVSDEGPGIPATEIERLKRPFTRLESARSEVSGTGLGLAIVERIARSHGGRLELEPGENGRGLRAVLVLPGFS